MIVHQNQQNLHYRLASYYLEKLQTTEAVYQLGQAHSDFDSNQLTSLPPEIGQLINLVDLELSNNELTSLPPRNRTTKTP